MTAVVFGLIGFALGIGAMLVAEAIRNHRRPSHRHFDIGPAARSVKITYYERGEYVSEK